MVRFHFHVIGNGSRIEDLEGQHLDGLEAAREEAVTIAREIMSNRILRGTRSAHWKFEIANEAGQIVLELPFAEAID
jgi:hypothetical protein